MQQTEFWSPTISERRAKIKIDALNSRTLLVSSHAGHTIILLQKVKMAALFLFKLL